MHLITSTEELAMLAARTKRSAVAFLFVASTITASVAWFATLGWGLVALLQVLLSAIIRRWGDGIVTLHYGEIARQ